MYRTSHKVNLNDYTPISEKQYNVYNLATILLLLLHEMLIQNGYHVSVEMVSISGV